MQLIPVKPIWSALDYETAVTEHHEPPPLQYSAGPSGGFMHRDHTKGGAQGMRGRLHHNNISLVPNGQAERHRCHTRQSRSLPVLT
jgi:hypothetical protein